MKVFIKFEKEQGLQTRKQIIQDALRPLGEIEIVEAMLHKEGLEPMEYGYGDEDLVFADHLVVKYYMVTKERS